VAAAGAGYEIYEHEKKKYDQRRQQGGPPPPGGAFPPPTPTKTCSMLERWRIYQMIHSSHSHSAHAPAPGGVSQEPGQVEIMPQWAAHANLFTSGSTA